MSNIQQITVVQYDPAWSACFNALKKVFETHLNEIISDIQHVGSTSVPGVAAKPVIDIDLVIEEKSQLQQVIMVLNQLGYQHRGEMGITGRDAFGRLSAYAPDEGSNIIWPEHNLYCCVENSPGFKNHILFRDFLRQNSNEALAYGMLKMQLASKYPNDINSYVEHKTSFITEILTRQGLSEKTINDITRENSFSR